MVRIYIADGLAEERSALRLVLRRLDMVVVGEAADWETTLAKAPATRLDILMVDWGLLPDESGTALDLLRAACPGAIIVILISHMDARKQAALSAGADVFISKGELPERVAERLRGIAASVPLK
ncbi:MAG: response regulator [Anaerolineae bacterium]|nr:response regulator [Anaerolineae bacterium]